MSRVWPSPRTASDKRNLPMVRFDCGFHCEPNSHVDGLLHYQVRGDEKDTYTYEPISFKTHSVAGLLWEMMDALADQIGNSD